MIKLPSGMKPVPFDYQEKVLSALFDSLSNNKNPVVDVCVGGGKSFIAAFFAREVVERCSSTRILVLTHVAELVEQDYNAFKQVAPDASSGIYSAGLGRKETDCQVTFASIQSIAKMKALTAIGPQALVIVDECHRVSPDSATQYQDVIATLRSWGEVNVIGMSGTPYRSATGSMLEGENAIFDDIVGGITMQDMLRAGRLKPLVAKQSAHSFNLKNLKKSKGEYTPASQQEEAMGEGKVSSAVSEIVRLGADRKKWMLFCASVDHAEAVGKGLGGLGVSNKVVVGTTTRQERADVVESFRKGEFTALVSVGTMTTGFSVTDVDMLVLLRATTSPGLLVQICGRGMRKHEGLDDCLLLDFGQNILRHGPIDLITGEKGFKGKKKGPGEEDANVGVEILQDPTKVCYAENPKTKMPCMSLVERHLAFCPDCGSEFEEAIKHESESSDLSPLSTKIQSKKDKLRATVEKAEARKRFVWYDVTKVEAELHRKIPGKGETAKPASVRMEYWNGMQCIAKEWLCFDHSGYARQSAEKSWRKLGGKEPQPMSTDEALLRIREIKELKNVVKVQVDHGNDDKAFPRICSYKFGSAPPGGFEINPEEIPF